MNGAEWRWDELPGWRTRRAGMVSVDTGTQRVTSVAIDGISFDLEHRMRFVWGSADQFPGSPDPLPLPCPGSAGRSCFRFSPIALPRLTSLFRRHSTTLLTRCVAKISNFSVECHYCPLSHGNYCPMYAKGSAPARPPGGPPGRTNHNRHNTTTQNTPHRAIEHPHIQKSRTPCT